MRKGFLTISDKSDTLREHLFSRSMKKSFLLALSLFLTACATPQGEPPEEVGQFPPDYIVSLEASPTVDGDGEDDPESSPSASPTDNIVATASPDPLIDDETTTDVVALREQNTELALEVESLQQKLLLAQEQLSTNVESASTVSAEGLSPSHLQLLASAITGSEQAEYPFRKCGQLQTLLQESWFSSFSDSLNAARIRFANGFLETTDLFGGCVSTEGNMAFFLGAERGEVLEFILLKYRTDTRTLEPALLLDGSADAVVTEFGNREGPYVNFPADDGRTFRYYYDANVVVQQP